jgi:hypothetical protein
VAMGLKPLASTLGPFDWEVMASGNARYWQLAWDLLAEQRNRLALDAIATPSCRMGDEGTCWTPAVDLALDDQSAFAVDDAVQFVPARLVGAVAAGDDPERLLRGTVLRLECCVIDRVVDGIGVNVWSVTEADLGVPFLRSAFEGRWGGAPALANLLIVPLDHPIVGDDERADRLVRDLQDITRAVREADGLAREGRFERPRLRR